VEFCKRYQWVCTRQSASANPSGEQALVVADRINRQVNGNVAQLSDAENYGAAEYWTLPVNGKGDCEDFVLQKYRLLLDAGFDSADLSIAVVADKHGDNHAVLILRHSSGDLVLDSISSRILPWNQTGYGFLAMQSGVDEAAWEVVIDAPRDSNLLARR
jgi:predicted transglutaminase-like cysteine proteinase